MIPEFVHYRRKGIRPWPGGVGLGPKGRQVRLPNDSYRIRCRRRMRASGRFEPGVVGIANTVGVGYADGLETLGIFLFIN
jgi:hypothetical protein